MIDRHHIEALLSANGLPPTAADEEVRALLIEARWNVHDVETALTVLRESTATDDKSINSIHRVFWSDSRLSSADINSLLGVQVTVHPADIATNRQLAGSRQALWYGLILTLLTITIVIGTVFYFMYSNQAGMFFGFNLFRYESTT